MINFILKLIEQNFIFISYVTGFNMWAWDIEVFSKEFLYFLLISPILATLTGMIALLAALVVLMPILYIIDLFKISFMQKKCG